MSGRAVRRRVQRVTRRMRTIPQRRSSDRVVRRTRNRPVLRPRHSLRDREDRFSSSSENLLFAVVFGTRRGCWRPGCGDRSPSLTAAGGEEVLAAPERSGPALRSVRRSRQRRRDRDLAHRPYSTGPSYYGFEPLQNALAKHTGVAANRIVAATGTSMANYLAMASVLKPGDEVLIEHPTYELIVDVALQIGADIKRFKRAGGSFSADPSSIRKQLTPKTKLIALSNLHNPTSALTDETTMKEIGALGVRVMVDEVYLDAAFEPGAEVGRAVGRPVYSHFEFDEGLWA